MTALEDQARSIFLAALDCAPDRWPAFVAEACGGNAELRARVDQLLHAHQASGSIHGGPASRGTIDEPITAHPGMVIGPYKLMEEIGEGGMGLVFVAEQQRPVRRKVALKVIKPGMDTRQVVARFEAERQALALMDHPNIARVLDGGETERGRPYFVMELVKGVPITEYCDQNQVPVRARLGLFLDVCRAVQHAHQKGIIHRDIKPSNVLVMSQDGTPVVKVIDFGVAKAIGHQLTDKTIYTQFSQLVGTPLYMSPEQAGHSGIDVDTRTDIYALGVLLFELLTGTTPFDKERLKGVDYDEIRRIIREEEPPRPSTRLSTLGQAAATVSTRRKSDPRRLTQMVRGELDWIVMKALEKDRSRRYETASALAADVQRYLADEPVQARPPSAGYRLGKLLRRHKGPVLAASLLLLALLAGIAGTTYGMLRAEDRRAEAEAARDRTWQALDAMTSTITGDSLTTQKEISAEQKKFLAEVLTSYRELAGVKAYDEPARARTAKAALRVGLIEYRLGHTQEGVAAFRQAKGGYAGLAADFPAVPDYRYGLAVSQNNLGNMVRALGQRREAEQQFRQALALLERLAADFPAVPDYRRQLAASHHNLGLLLADLGRRPEAERHFRQAVALDERLADHFPAVPDYRHQLAGSHDNLGNLLAGLGKRREAEEHYRRALALWKRLAEDFPAVPDYRHQLAGSRSGLGILLRALGQWHEAEQQYRQALAVDERLADVFPAIPAYRRQLAGSHNNLGVLLADLGRRREAEQHHRRALALDEKLANDFPNEPAYRHWLAKSHNNLGLALANLGKRREAEQQYRQVLALLERLAADFPTVPDYRRQLVGSHNNLGLLLVGLGRLPEAEQHYRQAEALAERLAIDFPAVPRYQVDLGGSFCNHGNLFRAGKRLRESLVWYGKAIRTLNTVYHEHPQLLVAKQFLRKSHLGRAWAYDGLRKYTEAIKDWDRVIELSSEAEQPGCRAARAAARVQAGQVTQAVAEVAALTKSSHWNAEQWYDFACVYAVASPKSTDKKQEYADRAMDLLHRAVQAGYRDAAHMAKDTDLDPLRGRDDFKKLLAELANRAPGRPGKQP
jgi:serine/threonine protein kinase/tetratricopeptide (TPR) repeat protein